LTNGDPHALRILVELRRRGVQVDAVVCEFASPLAVLRKRRRDPARAAFDLARWLRRTIRAARALPAYRRHSRVVRLTGSVGGRRIVRDLRRLEPDLVLLGGVGILREDVIDIPTHGVVNAHPGLLPWLRGVGVVARSIERGVAAGCTCHYVDAGIDRGAIVDRRLVPIDVHDDLHAIEQRANDLGAAMLATVVAEAKRRGAPPASVAQTETHPLSRRCSRAERAAIDERVRRGEALALFEAWRRGTVDDDDFRLPPGYEPPAAAR